MGIKVWYPDPADRYVICTSATRPTGDQRITGMMIYETDTAETLVWNGTNWAYTRSRTVSADIASSQATSGSTELQVTSLVLPSAPNVWMVTPRFQAHGTFTVATDRFIFRIRQTNTSGTLLAIRDMGASASVAGTRSADPVVGAPVSLAGGTTLVATVQRFAGTGTFTTSGGAEYAHLAAFLEPVVAP